VTGGECEVGGGYDGGVNLTDDEVERLIGAAIAARERAHAPYSGFAVGAALLLDDGVVVSGCNVENASFGLTVCAERNAVAAAMAAGARSFRAIAVVADASPPASPCGACRQVLAEFGDCAVILANLSGDRSVTSVAHLLPNAFTGRDLKRG
jgi:cytidine deaminase